MSDLLYLQHAKSAWDVLWTNPANHAWIRGNIGMMNVWSPYFDGQLGWMPNACVYVNSYAIDPQVAAQHPDWILKDKAGTVLTRADWPAGNLGQPEVREYIAQSCKNLVVGKGYKGIFLDDVNLDIAVNGGGAPVDPATGKEYTALDWATNMVLMVGRVKEVLPVTAWVHHNPVWYSRGGAGDVLVQAQVAAADCVNFERGFGDPGITGGDGQWSLLAYWRAMERVIALGRPVNVMEYTPDNQGYKVACRYMVWDWIRTSYGVIEQVDLANWPTRLYHTSLGVAKGGRYHPEGYGRGVWERDFTGGVVLVNEPGAPLVTVQLAKRMQDLETGKVVRQVTLAGGQGKVLGP